MSTALPKWYTKATQSTHGTRYELDVLNTETQHVVIRFPGGTKPIKWDSDCKYCTSEMDSDFYPSHENNNPRCGGQGYSHCTCPVCWG